jgi:thymidylate kinase
MARARGVSIALMGIDGSGKTSLVTHLVRALDEAGLVWVDASRKSAIRGANGASGYPGASLERLWLESWRLLFGGGHRSGSPVDAMVPLQFEGMSTDGFIDLLPEGVAGVRRSGPVAAMWTEYTIDQIVRAEAVEPALARGAIVLSDGFGYKGAAKALRIARELPDQTMSDETLDRVSDLIRAAYGDPYLQPDIGILLDADAERSYRWRRGRGRLSPAEDLWLAGRTGPVAFRDLQSAVAHDLTAAAGYWNWHVLRIDGRPQRATAEEAIGIVLGDPRVRERIADRRNDV